ncbi:MAG: hypothetical protein WC563_10350 [Brevundimonas sp.]|jgi:poly(3-hydroxybutyrate) depolymerase
MTQTPTDALRLVPVEPTREQELAMQRALLKDYPKVFEGEAYVNGKLLDAIYAAALAAAPASPLPEGGGWQDISTAPKDGTKVLGWAEGDYTVVEWSSGGYWTLSECGAYASDGEWWPTHWMPLPAAPTGEPT